jgi:hypothetical protein
VLIIFICSAIKSIAGLQIDPVDKDVVWAATSDYPPTDTSPCGAAKIQISTGILLNYFDFTGVKNPSTNRCMSNDLIFDNSGNLYVTDFFGYQIIKVALATDSSVSVLVRNDSVLCNSASGPCPPEVQEQFSANGPNGIEFVNNKLIVAVSSNRIVTVDLSNGNALFIVSQFPSDGIQGADGRNYSVHSYVLYNNMFCIF